MFLQKHCTKKTGRECTRDNIKRRMINLQEESNNEDEDWCHPEGDDNGSD
jgi:hypothetical protein